MEKIAQYFISIYTKKSHDFTSDQKYRSQYFTIMKSTKFIINRTHVHNWSTHYIAMSF